MSAVRSSPVYFDPNTLRSLGDKLRDAGISSEEIATSKSTPRFVLHFRCTTRGQTFHLLGFSVPDSSFVAVIASGRKKQVDLVFQIHDTLLSFGGLSEDGYGKRNGS